MLPSGHFFTKSVINYFLMDINESIFIKKFLYKIYSFIHAVDRLIERIADKLSRIILLISAGISRQRICGTCPHFQGIFETEAASLRVSRIFCRFLRFFSSITISSAL